MAVWAGSRPEASIAHLEQYARQTGIPLDEVLARFGHEEPRVPEGFECVWEWFFELAGARSHNGFAWQPLSFSEIRAWAELTGARLGPWLLSCFRDMDREWLKAAAEKAEKNGKHGKQNGKQSGRGRL